MAPAADVEVAGHCPPALACAPWTVTRSWKDHVDRSLDGCVATQRAVMEAAGRPRTRTVLFSLGFVGYLMHIDANQVTQSLRPPPISVWNRRQPRLR